MNPAIRSANERYAAQFTPPTHTPRPARHLAIVACMDARLDLFRAAGLVIGDAHILRNAGGRVTPDMIRSLALSTHVLGTREVGIIHHTDCGLHSTTNAALRAQIGTSPTRLAVVAEMDFLPFEDEVTSVRTDLAVLRATGVLPNETTIWGAVFDVDTGRLVEVSES